MNDFENGFLILFFFLRSVCIFCSLAGRYADRIGDGAAIFLASVLEYLTSEVVELSGNACHDNKGKRIAPRHILLAVRKDDELNELLKGVTISSGGVLANINPVLLPKATRARASASQMAGEGNNADDREDDEDDRSDDDDDDDEPDNTTAVASQDY